MQNLRNKLIVGGAVLVLAAIGSVMNSRQSTIQAASGPAVTIDPTQLPLPVTGTVVVTGNVGITGTPSVNVASLPAVQLSGTPTVNLATQSPLMVSNLSDRGRTPYQSVLQVCASGSCVFPAVPSGHRLVIETISVLVTFNQPITFFPNSFLMNSSGIILNLPLTPGQQNTAGATQSLTAYFDSGEQPTVGVIPFTTPTVTLSGYLVDCTLGPCAAIAH
jgi:hypothetical protein